MGCHPRKAVELPGHHTEIFLRQFCLSCCLAFSCVVTFRRGKCREREWREGARVKRQQRAMLGCVASHPSKWQRKREGESWQFPSDELRKHTKPKTFAKNVKRNACPSICVSASPSVCPPSSAPAQFQHQGLSLSSQLSQLSALSSQFARPFVSVCLSACLVHPSVCLSQSQSQSQSQPQSPVLCSLSISVSV